ncbi:MAG: LysR family transcriptional regulator [Pseudomonadota bacterium]
MPRTLDLSSLRSFVAIADAGGVTRAANLLNLTQSAVSMQMKRLEELLDVKLLDRTSRQVGLTASGEQLLSYARRMLELNDNAVARLTDKAYEGKITLGVPHDIVYPHIPTVLQRFNTEFPRVKVQLISSYTLRLVEAHRNGECDIVLTTEDTVPPQATLLTESSLIWVGASGGTAWKSRPLRLAFEPGCIFRASATEALDAAGIPWEMMVESQSTRAIEASISADLAVSAALLGCWAPHHCEVQHNGLLPQLPGKKINLYTPLLDQGTPHERMIELLRQAYGVADRLPARALSVPLAE